MIMVSSTTRLSKLPSIFNATNALQIADIPKEQLNQVLWRWKKAGFIKSLGDRSDVWFNLVVEPLVSQERWARAVRMALPGAIIAGHSVLMRSGLTTQFTTAEYLIRPPRLAPTIDGAQTHERPVAWLTALWQAGAVQVEGVLPELDPGAAVADLLAFDSASIDEDEIDWDELSTPSRALYSSLVATGYEIAGRESEAPGVDGDGSAVRRDIDRG